MRKMLSLRYERSSKGSSCSVGAQCTLNLRELFRQCNKSAALTGGLAG